MATPEKRLMWDEWRRKRAEPQGVINEKTIDFKESQWFQSPLPFGLWFLSVILILLFRATRGEWSDHELPSWERRVSK